MGAVRLVRWGPAGVCRKAYQGVGGEERLCGTGTVLESARAHLGRVKPRSRSEWRRTNMSYKARLSAGNTSAGVVGVERAAAAQCAARWAGRWAHVPAPRRN